MALFGMTAKEWRENNPHALRFSKRGYLKNGAITNLPLYLAKKTKDLL